MASNITQEDLANAWAQGYKAGDEDHTAYLRVLNGLQDDAARTLNPYEVGA